MELDAILGGRAVQHRELQNHESEKFLSYFKPCIVPLEGGVKSGFKTPEEEEFETRLYTCKGKRVVHLKQVDMLPKIFEYNCYCMIICICKRLNLCFLLGPIFSISAES